MSAFAAVSVMLAACSRSGVVEAPMVSANAVAPVDAGVVEAPADAGASGPAVHAGDRYTGLYYCAQGRSDIRLSFDTVTPDDDVDSVTATVTFHHDGSRRHAAVDGAFRMTGTFHHRTRALTLSPESWITQPPDYVMVGLRGALNVDGTKITGTVDGPGCTSFMLTPEQGSAED